MKKFGIIAAVVILTISSVGCTSGRGPIRNWFCGSFCDTCDQAPPTGGCHHGACGLHHGNVMDQGAVIDNSGWGSNPGFIPGNAGGNNPGPNGN